MTVETATYIGDLNAANPGSTDPKAEGDDHLRLLKSTVKATFPNITGAMTATHTFLSTLGTVVALDGAGAFSIGSTSDALNRVSINASGSAAPQIQVNASGSAALVMAANATGSATSGIAASAVGFAAVNYRMVFVTGGIERLSIATSGSAAFSNGVTAPSFNGYLATGNISQFANDAGYITSGGGGSIAWTSITGRPTTLSAFTNDVGFITGVTSGNITGALGFTPYNSSNPAGYISGVTSGNITGALGYTPYNSSNPAGYITSSGNAATATNVLAGATDGTNELGYKGIPPDTSLSNGSALTRAQNGKMVVGAYTNLTVNTSVFQRGDTISFYQDSASSTTVVQGSGFTLRLAGTTTTGTRTIGARGFATLWFNSATEAVMSGNVS